MRTPRGSVEVGLLTAHGAQWKLKKETENFRFAPGKQPSHEDEIS